MAGSKNDYRKFRKASKGTGAHHIFTNWHHRAAFILQELIQDNERFIDDVRIVRLDKNLSDDEKSLVMINRYKLPFSMTEMLREYIKTDVVNPFFMRPPVIAVSTKENIAGPSIAHNNGKSLKGMLDKTMQESPDNWVYLVIDPECTQGDIEEWVKTWWRKFMVERLENIKLYKQSRVRTQDFALRNAEIYEHIVIRNSLAANIADKWGISEDYARVIASRMKKKYEA